MAALQAAGDSGRFKQGKKVWDFLPIPEDFLKGSRNDAKQCVQDAGFAGSHGAGENQQLSGVKLKINIPYPPPVFINAG
ncbi:hypothetical protein HMPREF1548_03025 [Clostridium sp. KLE 1755]|nr:hypothetical protein HMPREF1548_03025 [Clostridium sp. KLE 1755]